jgi:hypothetical protein
MEWLRHMRRHANGRADPRHHVRRRRRRHGVSWRRWARPRRHVCRCERLGRNVCVRWMLLLMLLLRM